MADPELVFQTVGLSKTGRREANEDSAYWSTFDAGGPVRACAVVCDGMGGHNAGEVASAMAVDLFTRGVAELAESASAGDRAEPEGLAAALHGWVESANRAIYEKGLTTVEQHGMGTTAAVAVVVGQDRLIVANVGDSKIFLVRDRVVEQLSVDHTALAERRRALGMQPGGPEDDVGNPLAHALTRSLGQEALVDPAVRTDVRLRPGDLVVVTSDGVTDVLQSDRFVAAVESSATLADVPEEIYRQAYEGGSKDNITVVLLAYGTPARLGLVSKQLAETDELPLEPTRQLVRPAGAAPEARRAPASAGKKGTRTLRYVAAGLGVSIAALAVALAVTVGTRKASAPAADARTGSATASAVPEAVVDPRPANEQPARPSPQAAVRGAEPPRVRAGRGTPGPAPQPLSAPDILTEARVAPETPAPAAAAAPAVTQETADADAEPSVSASPASETVESAGALETPAGHPEQEPAAPAPLPVSADVVAIRDAHVLGAVLEIRGPWCDVVLTLDRPARSAATGFVVARRADVVVHHQGAHEPLLGAANGDRDVVLSKGCGGFGTARIVCRVALQRTAFSQPGRLASGDTVSLSGTLGDGLVVRVEHAPVKLR